MQTQKVKGPVSRDSVAESVKHGLTISASAVLVNTVLAKAVLGFSQGSGDVPGRFESGGMLWIVVPPSVLPDSTMFYLGRGATSLMRVIFE